MLSLSNKESYINLYFDEDDILKTVEGENYIYDMVLLLIKNKHLPHKSDIKQFPEEYLIETPQGIQINTRSYKYLKDNLEKLSENFLWKYEERNVE